MSKFALFYEILILYKIKTNLKTLFLSKTKIFTSTKNKKPFARSKRL